jgi:hypothetical protein
MNDTLGILAFFALCAIPVLLGVVILKLVKTPLGRKVFTVDGDAIKLTSQYRSYAGVVLTIVFVPCVLWLIVTIVRSNMTWFFPQSPWAYAIEYDTESQDVILEPKPHDCEFFKAPIGSKYCHFNRVVNTHAGDASVNNKTLVYVGWEKIAE